MGYPKLVRNAKTPVRVVLNGEPNEFNEPVTALDGSFLCNYQGAHTTKYTAEKRTPTATGTIFIDGDILPGGDAVYSGYVVIFEERHEVSEIRKGRNLDGSVNFTELKVI